MTKVRSKSTKPARLRPATFRFIDLFAGVGGMRLGFESAGGACVFTSEWDKHAQKTYEANFGEVPAGDITKIKASEIPKFDVLLAGFPCQPFSTIGKRQGFKHPTQGTLFGDVVRILEHHQPRAFLLENVVGLQNHDNGNTLAVIERELTRLGYKYDYQVIDAVRFGVPQHRERIYIVGGLSSKPGKTDFVWPRGSNRKVGIGKSIMSGVTDHSISEHLQEVYIFKKEDGRPQIIDRDTTTPVKTLVASYHKIQRLTGTFVRDGETGLRLLTADECKAIMGFPKTFRIPVSRTQMYRQMGNSVAVPVIKALAKWMISDLKILKSR